MVAAGRNRNLSSYSLNLERNIIRAIVPPALFQSDRKCDSQDGFGGEGNSMKAIFLEQLVDNLYWPNVSLERTGNIVRAAKPPYKNLIRIIAMH